ncbi:MAG: bifunctional diaminohydroxyphosphoribosylaminopyrimidine deaminase/5-amino-6-(5-phosphoribosylamino)uracil reductase RibD [Sphingosinicella sp.]
MNDTRWMEEAIALGERAHGLTAPNPHVGCIIVQDGEAVGRGWTAAGGRPHAEAVALEEAGERAAGATIHVSLEPCAHESERGPTCCDLIIAARPARVVAAIADPDPRTAGKGLERLRAAGVDVETGPCEDAARRSMAGFFSRIERGRPLVTLKLAQSIDGQIALASGESQWITGEKARAHAHAERARADMVLVGRGTLERDRPRLDVRQEGLEHFSPRRAVLTGGEAPDGWTRLAAPADVFGLHDANELLVEGGAGAATAFLASDLVDRLLVYRAPIVLGAGVAAINDLGLESVAQAHGRWRPVETCALGSDRLEIYERTH